MQQQADNSSGKTLVVGVDGSPASFAAMRWAVRQAQSTSATIVAVYVMTVNTEFLHDMPIAGFGNWRRRIDDQLNGPWTDPARRAGITVHGQIVESDDESLGIAKVANEVNAETVVVGVNGRGNLVDRLLGSTTYKLVHHCARPVVIVPTDWKSSDS